MPVTLACDARWRRDAPLALNAIRATASRLPVDIRVGPHILCRRVSTRLYHRQCCSADRWTTCRRSSRRRRSAIFTTRRENFAHSLHSAVSAVAVGSRRSTNQVGYEGGPCCLQDMGPGLVVSESSAAYRPRDPEENVLFGVVAAQLETFLARQRRRDRPVPRFVERELRLFLECGVLAHGFLRVHCDNCGEDRVVAFSCKGRGFCSSCAGRRMADTAAHLVDRVLPPVPIRQWVLSLAFVLRYRLAYDARLVRDVLQIFISAVFRSLRQGVRASSGVRGAQCGAVTFVQRFGGALNLNVHFHTLVLDGAYAIDGSGSARFHALPPPDDAEVARVTGRVARRILALLERRGLGPQADPDEADPLRRDQPLLAELYGASVHGRIATGPCAGQ